MTRFVMRLVPEREHWLPETLEQIPHLEPVRDATRNPLETFLRVLLAIGNDAAVHLEDDVILTREFVPKIEVAIAERPDVVQQFFSLRKADKARGSRWMAASSFLMAQCFYMPAGIATAIYDYYSSWPGRLVHKYGSDVVIRDLLVSRRERYWLHVPSLVQHRIARSAVDPRRSSRRQSPSFVP